jgi:hypothetical protein
MGLGASTSRAMPRSARSVPVFPQSMPIPCRRSSHAAHFLLSRLRDVLVGVEESANVYSLSTPNISGHSPVECEFERATIEGAVEVLEQV